MSDELTLVHELSADQVEQLNALYGRQWWSQGRALADVRTMVENSSLLFAFIEPATGRLVAFCRLLTDFVYRGMLYDVIVDEEWRGTGIGSRLMEAVARHPRLTGVSQISLWCKPELEALYARYGFQPASGECTWMLKKQREG